MFEDIKPTIENSILKLNDEFNQCKITNKINMTIGVYYGEDGQCKLFESVKNAEKYILRHQKSKSYLGLSGCQRFNTLVDEVFYCDIFKPSQHFVKTINTAGGSAALRIVLDIIKKNASHSRCWLAIPAWSNYINILEAAGIKLVSYQYLNILKLNTPLNQSIQGEHEISKILEKEFFGMRKGDVVILQGPCHNPTGTDLDTHLWKCLFNFLSNKGVIPIFDCAYIGLSQDLQKDIEFLGIASSYFENLFVCTSFSKNFTIYNERVGALSIISKNKKTAELLEKQACYSANGLYFMPPHHGAAIVSTILSSDDLFSEWKSDIVEMRNRIVQLRTFLDSHFFNSKTTQGGFSSKNGIFSLLDITKSKLLELRHEYGIFIDETGRANISSLNPDNINYFISALKTHILQSA